MTSFDKNKHRLWDTVLPLLLCICFIASSLLFLFHMVLKSEGENIDSLFNAANQKKTSIVKQIEGDIQTLEGLAIVLGGFEDVSQERLIPILREINNENAFTRMGFAGTDGDAWLVDINGELYRASLSDMLFFQEALKGQANISDILPDDLNEGHYINYYGVRVENTAGEPIGVLFAVHTADVLRRILDDPVLNGDGFSNIVNSSGNYVLRSLNAVQADIRPENKEKIRAVVNQGGTGSFAMYDGNGVKQVSVMVPLLENRWYLHSMVPQDTIRAGYMVTVYGIMAIIVVACCMFALFITRQRITALRAQKMLMKLAYRDSLTGLCNYDGFKLAAGPILAREDLTSYILWYGDMKKFKFINDILGYEEGDKILKLISEYLQGMEGQDFVSCRISADNFAGISRCENEEAMMDAVSKLQEFLKVSGAEGQAFIELSVGVYRFQPEDKSASLDVLVNYANMAHKIAKEQPGSSSALYDSRIKNRQIEDSMLEAQFEKAMEAGEFKVYMQPKVNIQKNNLLSGAEVLVRWLSPERGLIPPDRFISLFEKNGRIVTLDRHMFKQTCRWFRQHLDKGGRPLSIAVNVSKVGLLQKDFIEYYSRVKSEYGIPDGYMELEFTEGVLLNDTDMFADIVRKLKANGFICSLDDFGSGYSSLNLLKELPIDVLKLDIMFFHKSSDLKRERIVISNFINLAKELKIETIAEGVENVDSVDFLKQCGCDVVQGYVFSKPMPVAEFEALVKRLGENPFEARDV